MSKMRKITALLVAMVMVFAMAISASAATITGPNNGHTYDVYQIIKGDYANGKLSNMTWGANATKTGAVSETDAAALTAITGADTDVAKAVATYVNMTNPKYTVSGTTAVTVDDGYYLIVDKGPAGDNEGLSLNIVQVVGDLTIEPKTGTVDFEKKIKDTNDTTGVVSDWQDSADYDVNDIIPFKLEGTVASDYANYKTYYFAFHDEEETGLEFQGITSVKIDGVAVDASKYEVVTEPTDDCTFEVIFEELKNTAAVAGSKVVVEYTSKLTSDAVLGEQGNVNKAKLEYSNNPNNTQNGDTWDKPDTDETPWDNVIVFTYKVVINKTDGKDPLGNAAFALYKLVPDTTEGAAADAKKEVLVKEYEAVANQTSFEFSHLDDGQYVLKETATPAGYNSVADMTFTVTAEHKITWTTENRIDVLTSLAGNKVSGEITLTANKAAGTLTSDVVNKQGSTLPTTGGMGTTMFYLIGALCVIGAGVLLISRKRVAR